MKKVLKKILKILLVIILFIGIFYGISFMRSKMLIDDLLKAIEMNDVNKIEELTGTPIEEIPNSAWHSTVETYFFEQDLKNYEYELVDRNSDIFKKFVDEYIDVEAYGFGDDFELEDVIYIPYVVKVYSVDPQIIIDEGKYTKEYFENMDEHYINIFRNTLIDEAYNKEKYNKNEYVLLADSILKDEKEYSGDLMSGYSYVQYNILTQKFVDYDYIYEFNRGGMHYAYTYRKLNENFFEKYDENSVVFDMYKSGEKISIDFYNDIFVGLDTRKSSGLVDNSEHINNRIKDFILKDMSKEDIIQILLEDGYVFAEEFNFNNMKKIITVAFYNDKPIWTDDTYIERKYFASTKEETIKNLEDNGYLLGEIFYYEKDGKSFEIFFKENELKWIDTYKKDETAVRMKNKLLEKIKRDDLKKDEILGLLISEGYTKAEE